jgi:chemotaxis protein CheC
MTDKHTTVLEPWPQIFGPATESASNAMRVWTHGRVSVTLDEVRLATLEEVSSILPNCDVVSTTVVVSIAGPASGQIILIFDELNLTRLVECLFPGQTLPTNSWSLLEWSALSETGNVFASAYLNAMSRLTKQRLLPMPPQTVCDYATSVLQQAVLSQAASADNVLFCRTTMASDNDAIHFLSLFVPSPELLDLLRNSLKR